MIPLDQEIFDKDYGDCIRVVYDSLLELPIPRNGGIEAGFAFLSDKKLMLRTFEEDSVWVATAIEVIRKSSDPNPFKDSTDEEIATELINRIDDRKRHLKVLNNGTCC